MSYSIELKRAVKKIILRKEFSPLRLSKMTSEEFSKEIGLKVDLVPPRSTMHSWLKMNLEKKSMEYRLNRISVRQELFDLITSIMKLNSFPDKSSAHRFAIEFSNGKEVPKRLHENYRFSILDQYQNGIKLSNTRCFATHISIIGNLAKRLDISTLRAHRLCLEICVDHNLDTRKFSPYPFYIMIR